MMKRYFFFILAFFCFLLGLVAGAWRRTTAFSSTQVVYRIETQKLKTSQQVFFEVHRLDKDVFQIKNEATGEVFQASPQITGKASLRIELPGKEGALVLTQGFLPWQKAKLTVQGNTYRTVGETQLLKANEDWAKVSQAQPKVEMKNISLTDDAIRQINQHFANWLATSRYGKGAMVIQTPLNVTASSQGLSWTTVTTPDGTLLGRLVGTPVADSLSANQGPFAIDQQTVDRDRFETYPSTVDLAALGLVLGSDAVNDYQSTSVFRVYHTRSKEHGILTQEQEFAQKVSAYGSYQDYYSQQVDANQASYQMVLADNGVVYEVSNYGLEGKFDFAQYKEAPSDIQKEYQKLLNQFGQ
ncbi:hypothetical protein [Streptococcus sp. DD12]|uniref:hypothetical protein n=1 Tax=Streptococcus sp. DD12 TaxID=1777880 RepID=UPI0007926427|nr:hypothetical protein [Streptococcus sp. DD12]KXT75951.1 hypothetical protein STRDD12_01063 [Streptococcus sp. DD12]